LEGDLAAKGDREQALKLLEDPDALMAYPEVVAALAAADAAESEAVDADVHVSSATSADEAKEDASDSSRIAEVEVKTASLALSGSGSSSNLKEAAASAEIEIDTGDAKDCDPREHLNMVFIGHVDAGKSTLSGSILYLMGMVDSRTIEKFEREAKQRNRDSWFLAFILDTSEEERAKGKTVEVGRAYFHTESQRYTILDAPGHKNYVPNMISGAAQADVGVLVISARKGEFETGFEKGGQTREHALLAKTLGIHHLLVVVNKMDDPTVEWAQERYDECVSKLKPFLKSCGYVIKRDVKFIPISGLTGANVLKEVESSVCPWWKEMYTSSQHNTNTATLIETFDSLHIEGRDATKPLRIPVLDRYFERGTQVLGKVESGTLTMGDEIVVSPTKKILKVDAIYINEEKVKSAKPGENVLIKFNCQVEDFQKGYVMCHQVAACPSPRAFSAQLFLVDLLENRPIFCSGYEAILHIHTLEVEVVVTDLICVIDPTGKKVKRPFAKTGQQCVAKLKITADLKTCLEKFDEYPALGRVTLRDEGRTIAIGKVVGISRDVEK
jgi:peptide chain release factor subunit 3